MVRQTIKKFWVLIRKYRKTFVIGLIIYAIWFFGLGILGGFMAAKGRLVQL